MKTRADTFAAAQLCARDSPASALVATPLTPLPADKSCVEDAGESSGIATATAPSPIPLALPSTPLAEMDAVRYRRAPAPGTRFGQTVRSLERFTEEVHA